VRARRQEVGAPIVVVVPRIFRIITRTRTRTSSMSATLLAVKWGGATVTAVIFKIFATEYTSYCLIYNMQLGFGKTKFQINIAAVSSPSRFCNRNDPVCRTGRVVRDWGVTPVAPNSIFICMWSQVQKLIPITHPCTQSPHWPHYLLFHDVNKLFLYHVPLYSK